MAEASKVRLVRCPKCGNLLPELQNFSLYECGGCGAVLRAKNKGIAEEGLLSEVSDDEKGGGVYEVGAITMNSGNGSETERENNGIERDRINERNQSERVVSNGSSTSRTEKKEVLVDSDWSRQGGEKIGPVIDQGRRVVFRDDEDYKQNLKAPIDNTIGGNDHDLDMGMNRPKYLRSNTGNELEEIRHPVRPFRSRSIVEDWSMERTGSVVSQGSDGGVLRAGSFAKVPYHDEGPSNYDRGSYDRYGEHMRYRESMDGLARVANLENDRAELLKKLDELKDQLSNSSDVTEKPKERIAVGRRPLTPPDPYARRDAYKQEGFPYGVDKQPLPPDKHIPRPSYFTHSYGYVPYVDPHDLAFHDSHPPRNFISERPGYNDAYYPQMSRRPPHKPPLQHSQQTYQEHLPDYYVNYNQDPFMSHPPGTFFHQPACSCSYCLNKNWQGPAQIQPPGLSNLSSRHGPPNAVSHHHMNMVAIGPKGYVSDGSHHRFHSRDRQPLTRTPSDLDSENGGFGHYRPRELMVSKGRARVCYPIAGGAPFIACCHCFELLKIPSKLQLVGKDQRKLRCGACSSTLLLESGTKGIIIAVSEQTNHASEDTSEFSKMSNDNLQSDHDCLKTDAMNPGSSDHDNSNRNIQLADTEPNLPSKERMSNSCELEKRQYPRFSSSSFSADEQSPDSVIVREDVSRSAELPLKDNVSSPLPDSPNPGHPDRSLSNDVVDRYGKGYKIEHTDGERGIIEKITSRQSSVKDAPIATEMDISVNEFSNSGISQDSTEVSKEGGSRINKFAGIIKRSFKDLSRSGQSNENVKPNIFVNGQPIPDRVLKKVEKVAGPIQPGEYWYDYRAGFWGVMGHPCFGIIPPKIEEFNYPIPENCANGNTNVFVNGRELHQKDLDLLSSRGLPLTRHRSYLVEISGKVVDEHTGEELDNLGKLAPTVERAGHGFGMKVPKSIAQQA